MPQFFCDLGDKSGTSARPILKFCVPARGSLRFPRLSVGDAVTTTVGVRSLQGAHGAITIEVIRAPYCVRCCTASHAE